MFAAVVAALVAALLVLVLVRDRARARAELTAAREELADLRSRVDTLAARIPDPAYVITEVASMGQLEGAARSPAGRAPGAHARATVPVERIGGKLFADIVLRESVVKAAALSHGVRRALSAESRNRIRFEMRRELRRARKQRKEDLREARRELDARRRGAERLAESVGEPA